VTHDQEEALEVADRIVIMNQGRIEQVGTPGEVYHHPANIFVLDFLGNVNRFYTRIEEGETSIRNLAFQLSQKASMAGKPVTLYVRPDQFEVSHVPRGLQSFKATIKYINPAGSTAKMELTTKWGDLVQVEIPQRAFQALALKKNEEVYLTPKEIRVDSEESGFFDRTCFTEKD